MRPQERIQRNVGSLGKSKITRTLKRDVWELLLGGKNFKGEVGTCTRQEQVYFLMEKRKKHAVFVILIKGQPVQGEN